VQQAKPGDCLYRYGQSLGVVPNLLRVLANAPVALEAYVNFSEALAKGTATQTAMLGHLPYTVLRDAILTHLTMSEGLNQLLANVQAR
jgi:hypothetical protein